MATTKHLPKKRNCNLQVPCQDITGNLRVTIIDGDVRVMIVKSGYEPILIKRCRIAPGMRIISRRQEVSKAALTRASVVESR